MQLLGVNHIKIGENCVIGEYTTITINGRTNDYKVRLQLGDNSYIGRNNFISVGRYMEIGEYCIFGNNCSLVCSDHAFEDPRKPYSTSGATMDKSIIVGCNCWFGINVTVIGNVRIGHGSIIGANTLVTKDIPPFSLVVGNPARIVRRYDFEIDKWVKKGEIKEGSSFYDESFYLAYLKKNADKVPMAYYSASSQFGDLY